MKTICIANQKGGVGKSTTAQALWKGLSNRGHRTLLVDLDPQGNVSYATGVDGAETSSYALLKRECSPTESIQKTDQGHIIASDRQLGHMDMELTATGKEFVLRESLQALENDYDFVVLDTPPALGILTVNAMTASDLLVIPAQTDIYSLQGIGQLLETISAVQKYCNRDLQLHGVLLTRHNGRSILSKDLGDMIEQTATAMQTFVYKSPIRECISLREAQAKQEDIFSYAPKSNATIDYTNFIDEMLERMN